MHTGEKHKANNLGDDDLLANNLYSETKSQDYVNLKKISVLHAAFVKKANEKLETMR